jgi:hypothetical protein
MFSKFGDQSIFSWSSCNWNIHLHKRANLRYYPKENHLMNDPWFILSRENVKDCFRFILKEQKMFKTICQGGLANESIFAIILKNAKKQINKHTHLTDWSRMSSPTSPYLFIEGSQRDLEFINKGLRENEYAMFLRKVSSSFPDDILRSIMMKTDYIRVPSKTEGNCLTISSLFFLIPGIYGFNNDIYSLSILSIATAVVSVNYWRHPIPGWRKNLDLIFAKISFVVYLLVGIYNICNIFLIYVVCLHAIVFMFSGCMIIVCYAMSNYFWNMAMSYWLFFHVIFHMFVTIGQLSVIYGSLNKCIQ